MVFGLPSQHKIYVQIKHSKYEPCHHARVQLSFPTAIIIYVQLSGKIAFAAMHANFFFFIAKGCAVRIRNFLYKMSANNQEYKSTNSAVGVQALGAQCAALLSTALRQACFLGKNMNISHESRAACFVIGYTTKRKTMPVYLTDTEKEVRTNNYENDRQTHQTIKVQAFNALRLHYLHTHINSINVFSMHRVCAQSAHIKFNIRYVFCQCVLGVYTLYVANCRNAMVNLQTT